MVATTAHAEIPISLPNLSRFFPSPVGLSGADQEYFLFRLACVMNQFRGEKLDDLLSCGLCVFPLIFTHLLTVW